MKKIGFLLTVIAFFGFATLTSCNQAPKEEGTVEEAVEETQQAADTLAMDEGVVEETEEVEEVTN